MNTPHKARALPLALLAAGLTAMSLLATPAAHATPIDTGRTGTINIYKYQTPATGTAGDGTPQTPATAPIPGVTFTVTPVTIPGLTVADNQWWVVAENIANRTDTTTGVLGSPSAPVVTNTAGLAQFANLPLGLYLVTETAAPAGVSISPPFYLTVPLTDPANLDNWLYDVYAYPKDSVTTLAKTVTDTTAVKAGDTVTWTVTATVPKETTLTQYQLVDPIDPRLTFTGATVALNGAPLTVATDYTVTGTTTVTINLATAGLAKLAALAADTGSDTVVFTLNTTVNTAGPFGQIGNQATLNWDNGAGPVTVPSNTSLTEWGDIVVTKTNSVTNAPVAGATFVLYTTQADAKAGANPVMTAVDNGDGTYLFPGVRANDWQDGAALDPPGSYWVAETKAPNGYQLLPAPFAVQLLDVTDAGYTANVAVKEAPTNPFVLAITGGYGATWTALIYTAAALLLAGAVAVVFFRRRREAQAGS